MKVTEYLKSHTLLLDGGMGTLLQSRGLKPGEPSESWNLKHPEIILEFTQSYYRAGSNVVNTNTFGVNGFKYEKTEAEKLVCAALDIAKRARDGAGTEVPKYVALDLGPMGRFMEPFGDMTFEQAVEAYAGVIRSGAKNGADLIMIETMIDLEETRAALTAAKQNCDLPVFASGSYQKNGRLLTGGTPAEMIEMLCEGGAAAIGVNCSFGPQALLPVVQEYLMRSPLPVLAKPNAGMPVERDGKTGYDISKEEFAAQVAHMVSLGVQIAGGCCGTTPEYIGLLAKQITEG